VILARWSEVFSVAARDPTSLVRGACGSPRVFDGASNGTTNGNTDRVGHSVDNKTDLAAAFIERWQKSGAAERANFQSFLMELCDLLAVPHPDPTRTNESENAYGFEKSVTFTYADGSSSGGRIDLYKRGCSVLEAKQGSDQERAEQLALFAAPAKKPKKGTAVRGTAAWDDAMVRARGQAESYAKALPQDEGWPPFLIVIDVGHCIELYADFARIGKAYTQFPDAASFRIPLVDLAQEKVRERLRAVWTDPVSLDPAKLSGRVTREIADRLGRLAKSLEAAGHAPKSVATFHMRCLFTMFAEDVGLLRKNGFSELLQDLRNDPAKFAPLAKSLWDTMNKGGFSPVLRDDLLRFNGGLFQDVDALPVTAEQLALLIEAAKADWKDVEPAIFGTLLERALDPQERHKLGAHYTPRAYVERLVMPTVIEPLRADWVNVKAAAVTLAVKGETEGAIAEVKSFHQRLCETRVLDPACGSCNFLYVTMEHMKRLEGEVLDFLRELGESQYLLEIDRHTVDPHQFLGIEFNPRAAVIAELVLWIGYLQWHFRTRGRTMPTQPVLKNFNNIENRDAVLAWDRIELVRDEHGRPVTRWDGRTTKKHPITGEDVPDETARVEVERYVNARPAEWPQADFVIGNPPFIGTKRMRAALGDGYVDALRSEVSEVPDSADFVMYWWNHAARLTRMQQTKQFGLISTNSLTQAFNRKVVAEHLNGKQPLSIIFAVPDHPWIDTEDGAAVRISMTVGTAGTQDGRLATVVDERSGDSDEVIVAFDERRGRIFADLSIGTDATSAVALEANGGISGMGSALHGAGFILTPDMADRFRLAGDGVIRRYIGGRDLLQTPRELYVIDFSGMTEVQARTTNPAAFQHVIDYVLPERQHNRRDSIRTLWWRFGWERPLLRRALSGLDRYIATTETAKHRIFQFISGHVVPDHMVVTIASADAYVLAVLSSSVHVSWALHAGGTLEDRPRYNKNVCFDPFPFPACTEDQKQRIRDLGEQLDKHRKERQALHPDLTMTGMYNVLEKLKTGAALTTKEKDIHEKGLVSVLKQIHDDLDAAVFAAYGWPPTLSDEEILERLVALNKERAVEERRGLVRWLRPEFQAPRATVKPTQEEMDVAPLAAKAAAKKPPWPKALPEQVQAVRAQLAARAAPIAAADLARAFRGARSDRVEEVLVTLAALGQARVTEGRFAAVA